MAVAPVRFSSSDTDDEMAEKQQQLFADAHLPINGQLTEIKARIRRFEQRYEMPSSKMKNAFDDGDLRETDDICQWLMLLTLVAYGQHENVSGAARAE